MYYSQFYNTNLFQTNTTLPNLHDPPTSVGVGTLHNALQALSTQPLRRESTSTAKEKPKKKRNFLKTKSKKASTKRISPKEAVEIEELTIPKLSDFTSMQTPGYRNLYGEVLGYDNTGFETSDQSSISRLKMDNRNAYHNDRQRRSSNDTTNYVIENEEGRENSSERLPFRRRPEGAISTAEDLALNYHDGIPQAETNIDYSDVYY